MLETKEGVILAIKVTPKASKNMIAGWENDELKVRLNAVPEKGEANDELIAFLSKAIGIAKSQLNLISGKKSRHKKMLIRGLTKQQLQQRIEVFLT